VDRHLSRRDLLAILACPFLDRLAVNQPCSDLQPAGTLLGTLTLTRPGAPVQPFGVKFGRGLDARLVTDLSLLAPDRLITPNRLAYIRTECPPDVASERRPWTIKVSGLVERNEVLPLDELMREARSMGAHLFECAGNNNPANFGLMSVAEWDGVPLTSIVSRFKPSTDAKGLLVAGRDYNQRSTDSLPGASWIIPLAMLERLGAFLAVRMNGEVLPVDHGKPVRLVVPGWYGCAWIKWVDELRLIGEREPATSQMREFAGRTHQTDRHDLAIDYTPPEIQAAAMPVRVEKRRVSDAIEYRIVGIVWGGSKALQRLAIRFGADEPSTEFSICPIPTTHAVWSLWEFRWRPSSRGVFRIALKVPDSSVPQRRLDSGYYVRQIQIHEEQPSKFMK
jgi:DMSO/TMAO reductase YedYZ molybdopterin-dependent catalytic subunit